MASLLPHTFSILLLLLIFMASTTTTTPATSQHFPKKAHPTTSGYLNISSTNSLYFAFYEATDPDTTLPAMAWPLIVWLQGGPGCSSLIGNFEEIGPYVLHCTSLTHNPHRWNRLFGVLFIDNPLGTGFSVPASEDDIPRNQTTIAAHLHAALQSFMELHRNFRSRPLFLAGESYAGKYIPAAAKHILHENAHLHVEKKLRLKGIAIGNGMTDPVSQVTVHADQAYFAGLIDGEQRRILKKKESETVELVEEEEWLKARDTRNWILDYLKNNTGVATLFNYARAEPYPLRPLTDLINSGEVKSALGVRRNNNMRWVRCKNLTEELAGDLMKSVRRDVEAVLKAELRVLLFQGVYDLHLGPASVEAWVRRMDQWSGLPEFLEAKRNAWKPWGDGVLAGHVQTSGLLTNMVVAGAGHMAAGDNRPATQAMIEGWVRKRWPFAEEDGGQASAS